MRISLRAAAATTTVAVSAVALWSLSDKGIQDLPVGLASGLDSQTVTLELPTAEGIAIGADVRTGQRVVGRVSAMTLAPTGAAVQLSLQPSEQLPANATASVELPSALGSPFVRLSAPADPVDRALRSGDVIPPDHAQLGPQIESALATFGALMSRSGVDQLAGIVTELNTAFGGRGDKVRNLITTMSALTTKAAAHQTEFDQAMALAADITDQFHRDQHAVTGYLDAVPRVVALLDLQRAKLKTLLSSTTALAATADNVLSATNTAALVHDASTVVSTLGSFNDRLGATLSTMNTFLERFGSSVHGDYLMFDGALDIPGTLDKLLTGGLLVNGTPISGQQALDGFLAGGLK